MKQLYLKRDATNDLELFTGTEEELFAVEKFFIKEWRENGYLLHRIWSYGQQEWWQNGKYHREDGPAIIYSNGHQDWYQNGLLHRTNGPARIWPDGKKEYWITGRELTEEEFNNKFADVQKDKVVVHVNMNGFNKEDSLRMAENSKSLCDKHLEDIGKIKDALSILRKLPKIQRDSILEMNGLMEREVEITTESAVQEIIEISKKMRDLIKGELKNDPLMLDEARITDRNNWTWEWILSKTLIRVYVIWHESGTWACDITFPTGKSFIDTTRCFSDDGPFEAMRLAIEDFWNGIDSKLSEIPRPSAP